MQKLLSTFDVAPTYHQEYRNVMERFVSAFDKPVPLFGWTPEGARIVMGHVTAVEKRGVDLFGKVDMMPEHASYLDKKYVHMSWHIGGAHGIGLSEGHFSPHPHATDYDFAEDDRDGDNGDKF